MFFVRDQTALGKMILGSPKFTGMVCIWTSPSAVVRFERGEPGTSTGFAPKLREFSEAHKHKLQGSSETTVVQAIQMGA